MSIDWLRQRQEDQEEMTSSEGTDGSSGETQEQLDLEGQRRNLMHRTVFNPVESIEYGRKWQPRPSDIFIATFPKCGTTMTSQILNVLRTNTDAMNFKEITDVVWWDLHALQLGVDLNADQVASPRLFKSHDDFHEIHKGSKYVYVFRDPIDVLWSFYLFKCDLLQYWDWTFDFFALCDCATSTRQNIFTHFASYWQSRDEANILFMFYDDLVHPDTKRQCVRDLAVFMEIEWDETLIDLAMSCSSHSFMLQNRTKFNDNVIFQTIFRPVMPWFAHWDGDELSAPAVKVRHNGGKVGDGKKSALVMQYCEEQWQIHMEPITGCANFGQFYRNTSRYCRLRSDLS